MQDKEKLDWQWALKVLQERQTVGWRLDLNGMKRLVRLLDHPERHLRFMHIAGTNGKGSVAATLEAVCRQAGYRTGLYTSPHLLDICERIRINGVPISRSDFIVWMHHLYPYLIETGASYFETLTALALLAFKDKCVDIVLWEVGLGGRLDATNVVHPLLTIISSIGYDHQNHLGKTFAEIAEEKAGILKPSVPCITGKLPTAAKEVVQRRARHLSSPYHTARSVVRLSSLKMGPDGSQFDLVFNRGQRLCCHTPLAGIHQLINLRTAVAALWLQHTFGLSIRETDIQEGLGRISWPGRFERLVPNRDVFYDVGHNEDSVRYVIWMLRRWFPTRPVTLIIGFLADKKVEPLLTRLNRASDRIIAVNTGGDRGLAAVQLEKTAKKAGIDIDTASDVHEALERDLAQEHSDSRVRLILGSHYLAQQTYKSIDFL